MKTKTEKPKAKPKPLPEDASALIRVALRDLKKAERSPRYKIDMGVWHSSNHHCRVCLAGAVLAFSLDADPKETLNPVDFEPSLTRKLNALDLFRSSSWRSGLLEMGVEYDTPLPAMPQIPEYKRRGKANEAFYAALAKAARILKKVGM